MLWWWARLERRSHHGADQRVLLGRGVTHQWRSITFPQPFSTSPVVLTQCATTNGGDPVVTRVRNVHSTGFEVALFEEEANRDAGGHNPETVHWIAAQPKANAWGTPFAMMAVFDERDDECGACGALDTPLMARTSPGRDY
jgi:hypothetical protein